MVVIVLCILSSFEAVLNGFVIGQIAKLNFNDLHAISIFLIPYS